MGRPYTPFEVSELFFKLKEEIPDISIGSDFIVGFPGEREQEFIETMEFVLKHPFSYLHVFPFSRRPGTLASDFPDQVQEGEKKRRVETLRALGLRKKREFYQGFIGKRLKVLSEASFKGLSRNYIKCVFQQPIPQGEEFEALGLELKDDRLLVKPLEIATTQ
jgi:threonylcarbamoyladenosine tRNA methylthiotransferase MtaB